MSSMSARCAEKNILRNVDDFPRGLIRDGGRQSSKIFGAFPHEILHHRLVRHRRPERAIDRNSFGLNQLEEIVDRQPAAMLLPIAHREHIHSVSASTGIQSQGLEAGDLLHQFAQILKVLASDRLLLLKFGKAMNEQGGLVLSQTTVPTKTHMLPSAALDARPSGVMHRIRPFEHLLVIGGQGTAFTGRQIFGRLKAEGRRRRRANPPARFPRPRHGLAPHPR